MFKRFFCSCISKRKLEVSEEERQQIKEDSDDKATQAMAKIKGTMKDLQKK